MEALETWLAIHVPERSAIRIPATELEILEPSRTRERACEIAARHP